MSRPRSRRSVLSSCTVLVLALSGAVAGVAAGPGAAMAAADPVAVTVDVHAGRALVPATGLGVNDAIWDTNLGTDASTGLLREAGVTVRRYPGGSYADIYHWKDHTAVGGYVAPNTDFDTFIGSVRKSGAQPIVIANYGTGTAQEAADWVRYANKTKKYGVRYWEIGNENYGNGHYGSAWEADDHADKSPSAYAKGVVEYAAAMKAVDPSLKIGAVLTTPGNWPDAIVADGDSGNWNQTVLSIAGPAIDFVVLHWYPGGSDAADALRKPAQAQDLTELTRAQITRFAGAGSDRIGISLTELNAGAGVNTAPGALFAADAMTSLWAAGVFTVDWWNVRNGIDKVTTVAGQTDYNDFGLFSSGTCLADGVTCEPTLNTPFAPYHALTLLDGFAATGDQLVQVTTGDPLIAAHAVRHRNGSLSVLLLNKDPQSARTVSLNYVGFVPDEGRPTVKSLLNGASGITTARAGSARSQRLPAYSLTTLRLRPERLATLPPAAGTPTVSAVTDSGATVTWPAAARAGTRYDVYLQDAGVSRRAGTTTRTTLGVAGIRPGVRYSVTVVAKDGRGLEAWSSPPATFVAAPPATSTCAVRLTKTADWGTGFVGSVDLTNTGSEPLTGWRLGFEFPRPWQSFGSGWNATWSTEGSRVTAADPEAVLAVGASTNVGFVASYAGPNVLPTVFTVNDTVCS